MTVRHRRVVVPVERRPGFSLLELMVVVAILAALTGVALPALQGWIERARFEETARQLPLVLAVARAEARADGVARRVTATADAHGAQVIAVQRLEGAATAGGAGVGLTGADEAPPPRPAVAVLELPRGCELAVAARDGEAGAESRSIVVYLPDGGAVASPGTVLRGPGGREMEVRFERLSGRVIVGPPAAKADGGGTANGRAEDGEP